MQLVTDKKLEAKFDQLTARYARRSCKKFTAKGICVEMIIYKTPFWNVDKLTIQLSKVLDDQEKAWLEEKNLFSEQSLKKACDASPKDKEHCTCSSLQASFSLLAILREQVLLGKQWQQS